MNTDSLVIIGTTAIATAFLLYELYKKKEEESSSSPSISIPSFNIPSISIPKISISTYQPPTFNVPSIHPTTRSSYIDRNTSYTPPTSTSSQQNSQQNTVYQGWYGITKPGPGQNQDIISSGSDVCTITLVDRSGIGGRVAYYAPDTNKQELNNYEDPWYQINQTKYTTLPPNGSVTISTPCWAQVDVLVGESCAIHPNCHWYFISKPENGKTYYVS